MARQPQPLPSACPACGKPTIRKTLTVAPDRSAWFCSACDLGFGWPRRSATELARYYRDDYYRDKGEFDAARIAVFEQDFRQAAAGLRPTALLDFGCGLGHFMKHAAELGWSVTGLDLSPDAVEHVRKQLGLDATTGGIELLVSMGRRFQVVTAWNVIDHLDDPAAALSAIRSVLLPGGRIGLRIMNFASRRRLFETGRLFGLSFLRSNFNYFDESLFTPSSIKRILTRCGFCNPRVRNSWLAGDTRGGRVGRSGMAIAQAFLASVHSVTRGRVCLAPSLLVTAESPPCAA